MPLTTGLPGQPVRTYTIPGGGGDKGQLVTASQPKDLYTPTARLAVTAADLPGSGTFDVTLATPFDCADASWLSVSGTCDAADASIEMVLAYFDADSNLIAVSAGFGLATGGTYVDGGGRFATIGNPTILDLAVADSAALFVTFVSDGSWDLRCRPF